MTLSGRVFADERRAFRSYEWARYRRCLLIASAKHTAVIATRMMIETHSENTVSMMPVTTMPMTTTKTLALIEECLGLS